MARSPPGTPRPRWSWWGRTATAVTRLSLSRLNHWLPRIQAHPEVVQGTAEFHHEVADPLLPQADAVLHDTTALDAAVDMLDPEPPLVERLVGQVLLQGQLRTAWFLRRHEDLHLRRHGRSPKTLSAASGYATAQPSGIVV